MEDPSSTGGESRATPTKHERSTDRTVIVLFMSGVVALYGVFGLVVYSFLSLVF